MKLKFDIETNIYYQNNKDYFIKLVQLIENNPRSYVRMLKSKCSKQKYIDYSYLKNWIDISLPLLKNEIYTYNTKCYWIINNIQNFPICPVCKKPILKNILNIFKGYSRTCSYTCMYKDITYIKNKQETNNKLKANGTTKLRALKAKQTYTKRTGYTNPSKNPKIKDKKKQTYLKHYGTDHNMKSKIGINEYQTAILDKYGVKSIFQLDKVKEKIRNTNNKKLNCDYPMQNFTCKEKSRKTRYIKNNGLYNSIESLEKMQQTYFKKTGYTNPSKNPEVQYKKSLKQSIINTKIFNTKKKNNTFNKSKLEDKCYILLISKFGIGDVIRQYSSKEYPFNCDFYIRSLNLYIEINGTWTHGGHPFNQENINDIQRLNKWKLKAKSSTFYKNAIIVWTQRDVLKRQIAKINNLNFIEIWKFNDLENYLKQI